MMGPLRSKLFWLQKSPNPQKLNEFFEELVTHIEHLEKELKHFQTIFPADISKAPATADPSGAILQGENNGHISGGGS